MSVRDRYIKIFGEIRSLEESVSWCTSISNMVEWFAWETRAILGVSKKSLWKLATTYCHEASATTSNLLEQQKYVENKLNALIRDSEATEKYDPPKPSLATPREVLRRLKYFSEVYLNQEFDIFLSLASDRYLTQFYQQFTELKADCKWFTHGNSGLFQHSVDIHEMQMDNLSYNPDGSILIATELKLGGRKNPDQILKYAFMHKTLIERGFIDPSSQFFFLLVSDKVENSNWQELIQKEIEYCQRSPKPTTKIFLHENVINIAKQGQYASTTWHDILTFNEKYLDGLDRSLQQVEYKLLWGFNEALRTKAFMVLNG